MNQHLGQVGSSGKKSKGTRVRLIHLPSARGSWHTLALALARTGSSGWSWPWLWWYWRLWRRFWRVEWWQSVSSVSRDCLQLRVSFDSSLEGYSPSQPASLPACHSLPDTASASNLSLLPSYSSCASVPCVVVFATY